MIISNLSKPELKSDRKRYTNMTLQALLLYFLIGLIVISLLGIVTYLIYQFTHIIHLNLKQLFNFIIAIFMSIILAIYNLAIICAVGYFFAVALNLTPEPEQLNPLASWLLAIIDSVFSISIGVLLNYFLLPTIKSSWQSFRYPQSSTVKKS